MQMNALSILNAKRERPPSAGQSGTASARSWPGRQMHRRVSRNGPRNVIFVNETSGKSACAGTKVATIFCVSQTHRSRCPYTQLT
jgi:hypothetical protein